MTQRRQVLIGLGLAAAAAALKGTTIAHAETANTTPDWTFESTQLRCSTQDVVVHSFRELKARWALRNWRSPTGIMVFGAGGR